MAGKVIFSIAGKHVAWNAFTDNAFTATIKGGGVGGSRQAQNFYFTNYDGVNHTAQNLGSIYGQVLNGATPVSRRVHLYDQQTDLLVDIAWSDANGNYAFEHIDKDRKYYLVAYDWTATYNGVIASDVVPA